MSIKAAIEVLNAMQADGVIGRYAIAGAVAGYNYVEATLAEDLDLLVSFDDERDRKIPALESMVIEGWELHLLPVSNSLDREALADTGQAELRDENGNPVSVCILKPEYLVATYLRLGRPSDLIRISQFLEERAVDITALSGVLTRHGLRQAWQDFCARCVGDSGNVTNVPMTAEPGYPDISDILEEKAKIRRHLARRSFGEKIEAMEALRERLKPLKEARERRKAERERTRN